MWASPGADVDDLEEAEEDDEEDAALGPSMDFAVSESRTIHRNPPLVHSQLKPHSPNLPSDCSAPAPTVIVRACG
jgi:hypothetical protein